MEPQYHQMMSIFVFVLDESRSSGKESGILASIIESDDAIDASTCVIFAGPFAHLLNRQIPIHLLTVSSLIAQIAVIFNWSPAFA